MKIISRISVNFPTQPFLLHFCLWSFKVFSFSTFSDFSWNSYTCTAIDNKIVMEKLVRSSSLFSHKLGTEIIGFTPYVSSWCSNIKKMKAHNVCILWSLLIWSSIPYGKNMHGNKNEDLFSIIHSRPTSRCIILTEWYYSSLTGMAANKTYSFFGKMFYRFWRYYDEPFSIKVCKWNQKVKWSAFL